MEIRFKSISKFVGKVIFVLVFGSGGALLANYYLIPKLGQMAVFSDAQWLKKFKENVTIINKTEEVIIREDESVSRAAAQTTNAMVEIISVPSVKSGKNTFASKLGAGLILTNDGLVVTYRNILLESNADYQVILSNGANHPATLAGIDQFSNLAYLKIDTNNLSTLPFANSDDLFAGKKMIAVSFSPSDLKGRFSAGILGHISKDFNLSGETVSSSGKLEGVLRPDFALEPAFIGGPLIDYNGELAGLIGAQAIDNQLQYFGIPSNQIRKSVERLSAGNLSGYSNPGISYVSLNPAYALAHGLEIKRGALVYSSSGKQGLAVLANSPAQRAGILIGDIITNVGDHAIDQDNPFSNLMSQYRTGDIVMLKIIRQGQEKSITIEL